MIENTYQNIDTHPLPVEAALCRYVNDVQFRPLGNRGRAAADRAQMFAGSRATSDQLTSLVRVLTGERPLARRRRPGDDVGQHRRNDHPLRSADGADGLEPAVTNAVVDGSARHPHQPRRLVERDTAPDTRLKALPGSVYKLHS